MLGIALVSTACLVGRFASDGKTDVTAGLQHEVDALSAAGGGTLSLPAGTYLVHGLFLKDDVTLRLERGATILGHPDRTVYPVVRLDWSELKDGNWQALILADGAKNVAIEGDGVIDGNGRACVYRGPDRPRGLLFNRCRNVRIEGVTLKHAMSWMCYFKECVGVLAHKVTIRSHQAGNSDGFDIESRDVRIEDCDIDCGDDGICLKSDNPDFVVENVEAVDCRVASQCCAFKIGTATNGRIANVVFRDSECRPCSFGAEDTYRMTIMKGAPGVTDDHTGISGVAVENVDGGSLEAVRVRNVSIRGYSTPLFVRLGARRRNRMSSGRPTILKDVLFENVRGEATSRIASSVTGVPGLRVQDVVFRNVSLAVLPGGTAEDVRAMIPERVSAYPESYMFDRMPLPGHAFYVRHADRVRFEGLHVRFAQAGAEARPAIFKDDATEVFEGDCK